MGDEYENHAPVISSGGGGTTAAVSVVENTSVVTDVDATDVDSGDTLTFSLTGGADQARFTIDPSTGVLSFASPPDYENPADANADNIYEVTVTVSDGTDGDSQDLTVTVTDTDETPANLPPEIISNGGGPIAAITIDEGTIRVTTVQASDPEKQPIAYAVSGGADAHRLTIDPTTGALTFVTPPDYERPTDEDQNNVYDVEVTGTDGSLIDTQTIHIHVRDVNEPPAG